MHFHSIYLWQNKTDKYHQLISWCSQDQYGNIKTDSHFPDEYLSTEKNIKLRDKQNSLSLEDLLGETIFATFLIWLQQLKNNEFLRIHLINTLPESWQQLPIEWCQWQGKPLHKKIQLIRYASPPKTTLPLHNNEQALILNLWPQVEDHQPFFENIIYNPNFQVVQGRFKTTLHIRNNDISQLALLCIIAHGNETDFEKPLLCEKAQAWSLPERQLPPLVLLIACGGEQGNLLLYGTKLLKRGARTVLAAKGKLDAAQVTEFLDAFLKYWKTGLNAECILFRLQTEKNAEHAAQRIHIVGQSGLNPTDKSNHTKNISNWDTLTKIARNNNDALLLLLNQLTLHNLVTYSSLESSINDLYDALQLDYNDPHEKRSLLYDRLEILYPHCQPLTQKWLSYFLMYLSSLHQHHAIDQYQQEIIRLQKINISGSGHFFFYMASGRYRSRNHEQAMQIIADGFKQINFKQSARSEYLSDFWIEQFASKARISSVLKYHASTLNDQSGHHEISYKLFELALNISIVMGLSELGTFFLEQTNNILLSSSLDDEQRTIENFTQLDRAARLSIRTGDPDNELKGDAGLIRGLYEFQQKHAVAIHAREETGERELSQLLYYSAWLKHEKPNPSYCQQALNLLAPVKPICKELKSPIGNLNKLYLLRALAAWSWRQNDQQAIDLLEQYLPTIIELCNTVQRNNASPLGFIIAYMALLNNPHAKQQWFFIANKMLSDKCYFELAIFHRLLKQDKKAVIAYKKHQQQQQRVFENMKILDKSMFIREYKELLSITEQRLAGEDNMDIITMDLGDMQRLGFVPC